MPDQPRLPTGSEFSPGQVRLAQLLGIVKQFEGDRASVTEQIRQQFYSEAAEAQKDPVRRRNMQTSRANNVWLGMAGYGLVDSETARLTEFGDRLRVLPDDAPRNAEFAKHILLNLNGRQILDAIRSLQARRAKVDKASLARELSSWGFLTQQGKTIPENTTDHLILLSWLRQAGVLPAHGYEIAEGQTAELLGITAEGQKEINKLSPGQRAFLRVLKNLATVHGSSPIPTKQVKDQCDVQHPGLIPADRLRSDIVNPLQAAGWLSLADSPSGGRGGKSGSVAASEKLQKVDALYLDAVEAGDIPQEVRDKLDTPLDLVMEQLDSKDTGVKGLALEILAVRLAFELGLAPLRFRERSRETQGAEVDLIAEGLHLHFSRWLFQCKNTATVSLSALAKEIGMAVLLHAHVIVLVTTGRFAVTVKEHADGLAQTTPLQAVLIDGEALERYRSRGVGSLVQHLRDAAQTVLSLKRIQIGQGDGK